MRITRFDLYSLRNEEWINFFAEFKTFVAETTPEVLDIVALYATFLSLYGLIDEALEAMRKSDFTATISDLDGLRDDTFKGVNFAVQSAACHFDPVRREAGTTLAALLERSGNLAIRPYNEETSAIVNFVQELRGKYAPTVQILGLAEWVDELERCNNAFETIVLARNRETAGKSDLHLFDLRRQGSRCYTDMVLRIEARLLLQSDERIEHFVKLLNANVERYKTALKRRSKKQASANNEELTTNN
jgi:hypothetical protein